MSRGVGIDSLMTMIADLEARLNKLELANFLTNKVYKVPPVTILNSTTLTPIATQLVQAGTLGNNRKIRVMLTGDHLTNVGFCTVHLQILFGGVILYEDTSAAITSAAQRGLFWVGFELYAYDAQHVGTAYGELRYGQGNAAATVGINNLNDVGTRWSSSDALAIDTTVDQTLVVNLQHGTAAATSETRMTNGSLELIG